MSEKPFPRLHHLKDLLLVDQPVSPVRQVLHVSCEKLGVRYSTKERAGTVAACVRRSVSYYASTVLAGLSMGQYQPLVSPYREPGA